VRDALSHVRNPFIPIAEMDKAAEKYPKADPSKNNAVYYMRWEQVVDAISAMQSEQLEAEVLWGDEVIQKLKPLRLCMGKLNRAISQFLAPPEMRAQSRQDLDDIIYELRTEKETDAFSKEIDAAIEGVATFLKPKLKLTEKITQPQ
jgi:translation initiation factor 2B subunit (eIF-2B alpha/beta/delta family)